MSVLKKSIFLGSTIFGVLLLGFLSQLFPETKPDKQSYAASSKSKKINPVEKCYDSFYAFPNKIFSVADGKYTYYQILAQPKKATSKEELEILYFRTSNYRCEDLSKGAGGASRLQYMPKAVAIKFAVQWYQPYFDKCLKSKQNKKIAKAQCIKYFETQFNVPPNTNEVWPQFLYTDDAIALNRLGIKTDKALVVDTFADFQKFMAKYRNQAPPSK